MFLRFFDMTLQKNVKSLVFLDFEKKNVKNVFSNYAADLSPAISGAPYVTVSLRGCSKHSRATSLHIHVLLLHRLRKIPTKSDAHQHLSDHMRSVLLELLSVCLMEFGFLRNLEYFLPLNFETES